MGDVVSLDAARAARKERRALIAIAIAAAFVTWAMLHRGQ